MEDHTLRNYAFSSLLSSLVSFAFLLSISMQALLLLHRWEPVFQLLPVSCLLATMAVHHLLFRPRQVYVVDFSCLRPQANLRVPIAGLLEHLSLINCFDRESVAFMEKVITSSGLSEETYFPPALHYIPPKNRHEDAIMEAHMLLFPVMDDLLAKTGVSPLEVDVLVVNCSGFCPSPSLSAMVVHRYAMRRDVRTFNLSGMGCAAGAVSVDVARGLLAVYGGSYAVVLSAEVLSTGWYAGRDRRKLLLNCLFRTGSAGVLLTNRRGAKKRSKYRLSRMVRTQRACDDRAYASAIREEDSEGITGFTIERDLLRVARETLRANAHALGASVLPLHEKARYALSRLKRALLGDASGEPAAYVPDFSSSIQHYCVPASGKAVIKEIGRGLGLGGRDMEAAAMAFHRFGNQSAASMWYQLAYMEGKGRVKTGDSVWQLGMGSGPKCNSVVWECLRQLDGAEGERGPWSSCIHRVMSLEGGAWSTPVPEGSISAIIVVADVPMKEEFIELVRHCLTVLKLWDLLDPVNVYYGDVRSCQRLKQQLYTYVKYTRTAISKSRPDTDLMDSIYAKFDMLAAEAGDKRSSPITPSPIAAVELIPSRRPGALSAPRPRLLLFDA